MYTKKLISTKKSFFCPLFIFIFFLIFNSGYSQRSETSTNEITSDYRILNSTESYIELEFYPNYSSNLEFDQGIGTDRKYGSPDLKLRSFPVFFPGNSKNSVEIIDMKYEEIPNADVLPVPRYKKAEG